MACWGPKAVAVMVPFVKIQTPPSHWAGQTGQMPVKFRFSGKLCLGANSCWLLWRWRGAHTSLKGHSWTSW